MHVLLDSVVNTRTHTHTEKSAYQMRVGDVNCWLTPYGVKHRPGDAARMFMPHFNSFLPNKMAGQVEVEGGEAVVVMSEGGVGWGVLPGD